MSTSVDFNCKEYRRSRTAYMIQCTVQYCITLLMTDTFSSKLYISLGFSEATTGVLSSIITLAFLVQFLSIFLIKSRKNAKTITIIFTVLSDLFFCLLYLTPYLASQFGLTDTAKQMMALIFVISAYAMLYFVASISYKWANSFVEPGTLGLFSAKKEMISLVVSVIYTLTMGYVIDLYAAADNLTGGFTFLAITIFVITSCNLICFLLIKRDPPPSATNSYRKNFLKSFKYLIKNEGYVKIIILSVIYYSATYFIVGFVGAYKNSLLGTMLAVNIINTVAIAFRFFVAIPFGKYADKHSYVAGFKLGLVLSAIAYLCCVFTTPNTWYLIIGYAVFISMGLAGIESSNSNMVYNYVELDYIEDGMAIKACIGGLSGFCSALIAGEVVDLIKRTNPVIFGVQLAPQQILAAVSFVLVIIGIVFVHFVIGNRKTIIR